MKYLTALLVASFGLLAYSATSTFFTKEATAVDAALKVILKIETDYEVSVRTKNPTQLTHILAEIKKSQTTVNTLRAEIAVHTDSEHFDVSFFERLMLECLHIRTGAYAETLKTIAQEILGQQNGISEFPLYEHSAKIETVRVLLTKKFQTVLKLTEDTDTILATAAKKNATLTATEKTTIGKNLDELVKQTTALHNELAKDYASEIEVIHQQGKVLRLIQKMETESLIDEIAFGMHFIKEFHELFKRIDDHTP